MNKVSVIIPVYNVERYLDRCINSVMEQSNIKLEILLINDGSNDSSGEICDEFARTDDRIRVFHQKNRGVSSARNKGIDNATGDWICFVDADDWIEPNSIEKIINGNDEKEVDYIIARSFINRDGMTIDERYPFSNNLIGKDYKGSDLITRGIYGRGSVCGVIYRKSFILANTLYFPLVIRNGEDSIFSALCSIYADRVRFVNIHFYNVNERDGSASRGCWTFDRVLNMTNNIRFINKYIKKHKELTTESINILNFAKYSTISNIYNNFNSSFTFRNYFILRKEIKRVLDRKLEIGRIRTNRSKVRLINMSLDVFAISVLLKHKLISGIVNLIKTKS